MLMQAIDSYLQLRRAGGFQLRYTEVLLREFASFAAERGETPSKPTPPSHGPPVQHH